MNMMIKEILIRCCLVLLTGQTTRSGQGLGQRHQQKTRFGPRLANPQSRLLYGFLVGIPETSSESLLGSRSNTLPSVAGLVRSYTLASTAIPSARQHQPLWFSSYVFAPTSQRPLLLLIRGGNGLFSQSQKPLSNQSRAEPLFSRLRVPCLQLAALLSSPSWHRLYLSQWRAEH